MAYKRKFSSSSKYSRKSPAKRSKYTKYSKSSMNRKKLIRTIKAVTKRVAEPKVVNTNMGKTELYHNNVVAFHLNKSDSANMPSQGTTEYQRVGDQINVTGWSLRMLMGQKADRPNVTFRWWVVKVPKGSSYTYAAWFQNVTSNAMLDHINTDFVKVLKGGLWRPNEAGLAGTGGDEYTFIQKIWIPYRKLYKFGPTDGALTHNDDDIYFLIVPYDAYGALQEDNVAYTQIMKSFYYRDP